MCADVFLDTNILVYAAAKNDPRAEIATTLLAEGGRISLQVLNEFADIAEPIYENLTRMADQKP